MAALPTRVETEAGRPLSPSQIFEITAAREASLSRLLIAYISTGLLFMLLPGTFLGVWNLLAISSRRAPNSVSPAWLQAHGHAQIFGWIGSFILGIGFYSIPKLRRVRPFALARGWTCWALWTVGVTFRWLASVYVWHWRVLVPISAALELASFLIFFRSVSQHRPNGPGERKLDEWIFVVIAGAVGLLLALVLNFGSALYIALHNLSPALPANFDQRFLVLETWGFLVPFVWGFSAKWLPIFLGLRPVRGRLVLGAVGLNSAGVLAALSGATVAAVSLLSGGMFTATIALGIFSRPERPAKVKGVHATFPLFVRSAYLWALTASLLAIWAALAKNSPGIWGASRHALTVGFLATMVFAIGQRVLPAFSGMRLLFSTRLMFASTFFLALGCLLRVSSEVVAYRGILPSAWSLLPISAVTEMAAVTLFAINLFATFASRPPATVRPAQNRKGA